MTDREREKIRPNSSEDSDAAPSTDESSERPPEHDSARSQPIGTTVSTSDERADAFFAVGETSSTDGEPAIGGGRVHARIVDVDVVTDDEIPSAYPVEIRTPRALAFTVEFPNETQSVVYLEHRENGQDPRLATVLEATGTPYGSYADLYGERLLFEVEEGYWTLYVPRSAPRGSSRGVYGIWLGLAFNGVAILGGVLSGGALFASAAFLLAFLVINLVVMPAATLTDSWYLESHTDWDQGPLFWATFNAVPLMNLLVSAWYLKSRFDARPITP